ncbi:Tkl protein kinase, partial [Globisporangium splendens]
MSAWEEAFNEALQRSYFFNRLTGETSWTPPGEATSESADSTIQHGWQQAFDEASQTAYYYNADTGETSWTLPEAETEEDLSYLVFAVVRLQSIFRGARDRRRAVQLVKTQYQTTKDPVSGQTLYTNLKTNTSSWTKPVLFNGLGVDDDAEDDEEDDDANFEGFHMDTEQSVDEDDEEALSIETAKVELRPFFAFVLDSIHSLLSFGPWIHSATFYILPTSFSTFIVVVTWIFFDNRIHTLSPKLWKLRAMRVLNLSHNALQELPYVEGDLKLLRETREWQVGVGLLTSLISLTVSHNNLSSLPKSIEKCSSLQYLNLSHNCIQELGEELGELESLKQLYLRKNAIAALPDSIGNLAKLEILELAQNRLESVPSSTGNLQNLQQIVLSQNQLKYLPEEFGALSQLNLLTLDENPSLVTCDVLFRRLSGIRTFSANSCGIVRFETVEFLKDAPVQSLRLRHNALSEFPVIFSRSIMKTTLQELGLTHNTLAQFPMEVARYCHQLVHLDVSFNKLRKLPREIGELRSLEVVYLSQNELQELPNELTQLSRLRDLKCDHNRLQSLPLAIGHLTELLHLDVPFNALETLPASMMELKALASLYANDNALKQHPPAMQYSSCFCDYSNNPFNDDKKQVIARRALYANAMRLLHEKQFAESEALFTELLRDVDTLRHEEQKMQRPELHFARGVCRFMMMMKTHGHEIETSSWTVNESERDTHGAQLLHARWQHKKQQQEEQQQRLQDRDHKSGNQSAIEAESKTAQLRQPSAAAPFSGTKSVPANNNAIPVNLHEVDVALADLSLVEAAEELKVARDKRQEYAAGTLVDFQVAIQHGAAELPTAHYMVGLTHMVRMEHVDAIASFTEALKLVIPREQTDDEKDNNYAHRDRHAKYLLRQSVPAGAVHILLKRAEAYRLVGQLPAALTDVRHVLAHQPMAMQAVEDAEKKYAHEWEVLQREYLVDQETLFRAFDVASRSGLARRPEVVDLHRIPATTEEAKMKRADANQASNTAKLRPAQRFAAEVQRISIDMHTKRAGERAHIEGKYAAKQQVLTRTRDFKRGIRENLQLEMEEAQQRAVESELARRAELTRLELEREFNERLYMKYEDELMQWLIAEELRLERERQWRLEEAQHKAEAKAAYATRLARRGGRRQQGALQRGTGNSSSGTRGSSRNPTSSSSPSFNRSSAASTPATQRLPPESREVNRK